MNAKLIPNTIVATTLAIAPALAAAPQPVDVLAIYTIDADTEELRRYAFNDDSILTIGRVQTASGTRFEDLETLAYVPAGDGAGMYSVPTRNPSEGRLIRIDPLTATATVVNTTPVVTPPTSGGRKVTGMCSAYDSLAGEWYLIAASSVRATSSTTAIETRELVRINPVTGVSTIIATQADLGNGLRFEGLGIDANGILWAVSRTHFFRLPRNTVTGKYSVQVIGNTGGDKTESLEIAFGDLQPSINVPGVDPTWTTNGVFFVADEQRGPSGQFGILNPATGQFVEYLVGGVPSNLLVMDVEGMVILTLSQDPLYGRLITFD